MRQKRIHSATEFNRVMNELQRQAYLSALGIENYAPRWLLPSAPAPVVCVMPVINIPIATATLSPVSLMAAVLDPSVTRNIAPANLLTVITDLEGQKKVPLTVNAAAILQQLETKKAPVVKPFSLSVYRPQSGFLIIDSRNAASALPTELLLNNLLRAHLKATPFALDEEILRWPMIENRFMSRTEDDARNELQTWLAVENELRPIHTLWLIGENAARYWLSSEKDWLALYWTIHPIKEFPLPALILPCLNQLLQNPVLKSKLWASLP